MKALSSCLAGSVFTRRIHPLHKSKFQKHLVRSSMTKGGSSSRRKRSTSVFDYFLLMQTQNGFENQEVQFALEELWGLQYKVPGVVTGFIGPTIKARGLSSDSAVFFRFSNLQAFESFIQKSSITEKLQDEFRPLFQTHEGFLIRHQVANEMESIFRKGESFETGLEHVISCRLISETSRKEAEEFLSALCEIAKTTEIEAVESSTGVLHHEDSNQLVMINHFSDINGIELLENAPPVKQLWSENGNGLIKAEFSFCMNISPATNQ
eukprot:g6479.t1